MEVNILTEREQVYRGSGTPIEIKVEMPTEREVSYYKSSDPKADCDNFVDMYEEDCLVEDEIGINIPVVSKCPAKYFAVAKLLGELESDEQREKVQENLGIKDTLENLKENLSKVSSVLKFNGIQDEPVSLQQGIGSEIIFYTVENKFISKDKNGFYTNVPKDLQTLHYDKIYIYNGQIYAYNGTTLVNTSFNDVIREEIINLIEDSEEKLTQLIDQEKNRAIKSENILKESITTYFDGIQESEIVLNDELTDAEPEMVLFYKPVKKFIVKSYSGRYFTEWEGKEVYMNGNQIHKNKIYIFNGELYVWNENDLKDITSKIKQQYAELIKEAPETLDTIHEIAAWILNDKSGAAATATQISQNKSDIATEKSRAQTVEQQLQQSIAAEQQRAKSAEEVLAEGKANKDDYCPKLTTGFADNLVGRGESVEAQFTFRPTGGTQSVEDGVARIERIKGNTIVWNQLAQPRETTATNGLTIESVGDGSYKLYTEEDAPTTADVFYPVTDNLIGGHKVVFYGGTATCTLKASSGVQDTGAGAIIASATADEVVGIFVAAGTTINTEITIRPQVFDVTKMFGTGAAITTVSELRELFPKADNAYNTGELISFNAEAITTVGFNMFDKSKAVYGVINYSFVGYEYDSHFNQYIVSDYIRIVPGKKYYFKNIVNKAHWTAVNGYDSNKQYVKSFLPAQVNVSKQEDSFAVDFSDSPNICYVRICLPAAFLDSCCVSLLHTGYRNGDYEPYEETTRQLPIKEYFPNGMNSARNTFDELTATQAIKRVGVVEDLSKLDWVYFNSTFVTNSKLPAALSETDQIVSALNYSTTYGGDKSYTIVDGGKLYIKDSAYTDVTSLKKALAGVKLCYALANPVITDLSEPLNLDYKVSDFGTEATVTDVISAPMKMDVVYGFNAVDTIRNNRILIAELLSRIEALEGK